jgi:hypothetical protein
MLVKGARIRHDLAEWGVKITSGYFFPLLAKFSSTSDTQPHKVCPCAVCSPPPVAMHPAPCTYTMCMRQQGGCRPASPYHHAPRHQPHLANPQLPWPICVAETLAPAPPCPCAVCSPPPVAMHPAPCAHIMRMRQQGGCRPASPYHHAPRHQPHLANFPSPRQSVLRKRSPLHHPAPALCAPRPLSPCIPHHAHIPCACGSRVAAAPQAHTTPHHGTNHTWPTPLPSPTCVAESVAPAPPCAVYSPPPVAMHPHHAHTMGESIEDVNVE